MIGRHAFLWRTGGLVVLTGVLSGCDSAPPVVETPPPPVSVSKPLAREVIDHDDYDGRIAAVLTNEVRTRARGYLDKVSFRDGQMVKKGDLLFEIDPKPYQASLDAALAQKAAAEAALELAQKEHARTARLVRTGAASREELDVWIGKQAVAKADRLKALALVEQAKIDLGYTKISAPFAGKISRTQVSVGNLINSGGGDTLLTTINSVEPMYVYFDVPERVLLRYGEHFRKGPNKDGAEPTLEELKIPVYVGVEGEIGYPHQGEIDFADNNVNASTGTKLVRGVLPNTTRILDAGMNARVRIPVSDPNKSLLVTERAIGTDQGLKFVYIVNDQNVVERRDVKLGRLHDGLQVIREGVNPEDRVIVNGIQRARDGAKVEPKPITMPGAPAEPTNPKTKN
jgi:RND family efflux transporter MFP subunit